MTQTYWYSTGYKTRDDAEFALIEAMSAGDIDHTSNPAIKSYKAASGKTRYGIAETF
jgi:hypothetical protein